MHSKVLCQAYDLLRKEWTKLPVNQSDNKHWRIDGWLLLFFPYLNHVFELFSSKMATLSCDGNDYAKNANNTKCIIMHF